MNFLTSIQNCKKHHSPWWYITMEDALTDEQIVEIKNEMRIQNIYEPIVHGSLGVT